MFIFAFFLNVFVFLFQILHPFCPRFASAAFFRFLDLFLVVLKSVLNDDDREEDEIDEIKDSLSFSFYKFSGSFFIPPFSLVSSKTFHFFSSKTTSYSSSAQSKSEASFHPLPSSAAAAATAAALGREAEVEGPPPPPAPRALALPLAAPPPPRLLLLPTAETLAEEENAASIAAILSCGSRSL